MMNLNPIFSIHRKHSYVENGVSDFLFILIYDKKRVTFVLFFTNIHFLHVTKQKVGPIWKI